MSRFARVVRYVPFLVVVATAVLLSLSLPVRAGDEKHQAVSAVSARFSDSGDELRLTLLLANGDTVRRTYTGDGINRITRLIDLASRKEILLYVDLKGKEIEALYLEFGWQR
jgi:hypothetical protein